jgi:transcriptional regulator with XRE-family HTH domain
MEFAANLKRLRKDAKLSQEALALACGWSGQSRVGNYESGFREPELSEIPVIARALGVQVGELFGEAPSHSHPVRLDPEIVTSAHEALSGMYAGKGRVYPQDDVARFLLIYEKFALRKAGVSEAELLGAGLDDTEMPQGAPGERNDGVPDAGAHKRAVARRVRK